MQTNMNIDNIQDKWFDVISSLKLLKWDMGHHDQVKSQLMGSQ